MIKVLFEGRHINHFFENSVNYDIDPLFSSSVLIQTGGKNILVDSSFLSAQKLLLDSLEKEGLKPDDIDYVINTHYHLDHTYNNFLFKKGLLLTPDAQIDLQTGKCSIVKDKKDRFMPTGVEIVDTTGHMRNHCSVIFKEGNKTYVISGDAFREVFVLDPTSLIGEEPELFKINLKKIVEIADVLIPGHGRVLEGEELLKIKKMVLG